jgi:TRAP-type C4-dicarboxylate transport system substrate-binding protein
MAAILAASVAAVSARADDKVIVMKLSTATINDAQQQWMQTFVADVEKDSGGRIKGEIYPASQLGSIPRQIEGTQFGSIQGWIGPPEFLVGVDERFEVMTAPGLLKSFAQEVKVTEDPQFRDLVLQWGRDKGLYGVAMFASAPSSIIARKPIRHLAEFKGMKIRVLASAFANEQISRLGATPVAMSLGDVLPAIQQGAIDGAVAQVAVFSTMMYFDAAKYITETNHNYIFSVAELSRKWFEGLPPDLQKILRDDAQKDAVANNPWAMNFFEQQKKVWVEKGGELISLPPEEQATMMANLASVGEDLSKSKPPLHEAYQALVAAVDRAK